LKEKITYFPGCIEYQNNKLDIFFKKIGVVAEQIVDWNCCGAPPAYYKRSFFNKAVMPLRNLGLSQKKDGYFLYSGCQVCVRHINDAVKMINSDSMFAKQANYSLEPFNANLKNTAISSTGAYHLLDIVTDPEIEALILNEASNKINGHSILLYTGCYSDKEKIDSFRKMMNLLGAQVNLFGECCGGEKLQNTTPVNSERIKNANSVDKFFKLINNKADETNSDYILTICSMCEKNINDGIELSDLDVFAPVIGLMEFTGFLLNLQGFGNIISGEKIFSENAITELYI
jgi:heterodisulfide reductase subunit B